MPADDDEEPDIVPVPFVNPEIVPLGTEHGDDWEGCLSIPDIRGKVPRYTRVKIRGLDREGTRHGAAARRISRRASSSTRPITSTACCSSTG